jgi:hypothetical protein
MYHSYPKAVVYEYKESTLQSWGSKEIHNRIRLSQFLINKLVVFGAVCWNPRLELETLFLYIKDLKLLNFNSTDKCI